MKLIFESFDHYNQWTPKNTELIYFLYEITLLGASEDIPFLRNSLTVSACPFLQAMCRAVSPFYLKLRIIRT